MNILCVHRDSSPQSGGSSIIINIVITHIASDAPCYYPFTEKPCRVDAASSRAGRQAMAVTGTRCWQPGPTSPHEIIFGQYILPSYSCAGGGSCGVVLQ